MKDNVIISIKDLKKSFGGLNVLKGVTTEIKRGEVVVILGPSGCGKSTFLRCLNLLEIPDSGHILLDGTDLTVMPSNHLNLLSPSPSALNLSQHRGLFK